jgi:hypothetical protein
VRDVVPILGDTWREHRCLEYNPVRNVRKIVELREQVLWDGIVRAVYGTKTVR